MIQEYQIFPAPTHHNTSTTQTKHKILKRVSSSLEDRRWWIKPRSLNSKGDGGKQRQTTNITIKVQTGGHDKPAVRSSPQRRELHTGQSCSQGCIKTHKDNYSFTDEMPTVHLSWGQVSSLSLNLIPCLLCSFSLLELDCPVLFSSTADELGREIQTCAGAGAALIPDAQKCQARSATVSDIGESLLLKPSLVMCLNVDQC